MPRKLKPLRIATEVEATRIAAVIARRDARIAAKVEAAKMSAVESASAHRPVKQSLLRTEYFGTYF